MSVVLELVSSDAAFAIGIGLGFLVAFLTSLAISRARRPLVNKLLSLKRAQKLLLVYDPAEDSLDLVPAQPLSPEAYISTDRRSPVVVAKGESRPVKFRPLNVDVVPAIGHGMYGVTIDVRDLFTIGLGEEVTQLSEFKGNVGDMFSLLAKLTKGEARRTKVYTIMPNIKMGVTVSIPRILKSLFRVFGAATDSANTIVLNVLRKEGEISKILEMQMRAKAWSWNWIAYAAIAIIAVGIVLFLLQATGAGGAPRP